MEHFEATIEATNERGGGGALVQVPRAIADAIPGKGWRKVKATFNGIPYRGSLMPNGDGSFCLGILKSIRAPRPGQSCCAPAGFSALSFLETLEGGLDRADRHRRCLVSDLA